jgi:hypothetical protein
MRPPGISPLGGRERALLRHLQRRGPQNVSQLFAHFCEGAHEWYPEDLDRALCELVETGHITPPDQCGVHRLTLRSPL